MKKSILILLVIALTAPFAGIQAQEMNSPVKAENVEILNVDGKVMIHMLLNLSDMKVKSQEMVYLWPVLTTPDSLYKLQFKPVVVVGAKRNIALERQIAFEDFQFEETPLMVIPYRKRNDQLYPLTLTTSYQDWLRDAQLVFHEDATGCNCEDEYNNSYTALHSILPPLYNPQYEMSYLTTSSVGKNRIDERHNAYLNYELAKHNLLRNYKNNAEVLKEVDEIISNVRNHPDLNVTEFKVIGYASPEGSPQYNMNLSKERAEAFVSYLKDKYGIAPDRIKTEWKGEDWEGLYTLMEQSDIQDKDTILSIIENETDRVVCENKLKQLSGGRTYHKMLQEYYPKLRRNDYVISYISRDYTPDEARAVINTRPELLSLQEIYHVAKNYPEGSEEFNRVMHTAAKYYPEDETVMINRAAYDIKNGNIERAILVLEKIDRPEALNNLGIAHHHNNNHEKARECFDRASLQGLECAKKNANELSQFMAAQF